ncbi:Uma2 family endonuclease [Pannus brasiliensis CCIBt3594]|uniref:Uma2 family endonuclease n=1 Tax=Pannus brasiliensis CCIBt3594 TaxID=1427578 RepID=A0AAW9QPR2_9CHRO
MLLTASDRSTDFPRWRSATWEDYLRYRDDPKPERTRLFFTGKFLLVIMGGEGINHSKVNDLFIAILFYWFSRFPDRSAESLGRCLLEKAPDRAAAPDLVLYIGEDVPRWTDGEPRRIDLNRWRAPDLVGEISDTTLASDLDEKKQIYAAMGIPEYWVIDVRGLRVFAFRLQEEGTYRQCEGSSVLTGLPIALLERTLEQLSGGTNISAANWFNRQIDRLGQDNDS